ncbi:Bax inhibitor-1/YccA family protein [Hellea balneolensis]|uniref:Bax inhibitor-1/YccA family protein n=1 Tax=Hellea balneolensis TaxID=287478 RepID=UPI0004247353|nr:Bax inhibitor-1 family protein [Hellea balneolensis]
MNEQYNQSVGAGAETDIGLKSFMLGTYRYMAMAMGVTATVAFLVGQAILANPALIGFIYNPIVAIASIGIIMFGFGAVGKKLPSMSLGGVLTFLFGFAAFMGVLMSAYASLYNPMIVAKIFFMTVAMFAGLSLFGYTTGFNLSSIIKYAAAAFMGYILIAVVGMFIPALSVTAGGTFGIVINVIALAAIAVITAWETQMLKRIYYGSVGNPAMMKKLSAFGAASLLLAFINMFQILMSLFGRE